MVGCVLLQANNNFRPVKNFQNTNNLLFPNFAIEKEEDSILFLRIFKFIDLFCLYDISLDLIYIEKKYLKTPSSLLFEG